MSINLGSELGADFGSFAAIATLNKIATVYMGSMIEMYVELNINSESVRGAGLVHEYVPTSMQENICIRLPERNQRPRAFGDGSLFESGIIENLDQVGPSNNNGGSNSDLPIIDSNFESSSYY